MKLEQTWRWFGPSDSITLNEIKQTGATGIVTALHHVPIGDVWSIADIRKHKEMIEKAGLKWSVVESIPVHEDIKRQVDGFGTYIERYKQSIRNLGECGIATVCYNFMPVLDWTRTDLDYPAADGSTGLRFDFTAFAAFDLFMLERAQAKDEYSESRIGEARQYYERLDEKAKNHLRDTILLGLPGSEEGYTFAEFKAMLQTYSAISDTKLRSNLYHFLREIIPVAESAQVRMAIHPDDPPFTLFGLPRIVSTEADAVELLDAVDSPYNGLTLCTGSYGGRADNDLTGMAERLGYRINFIHLRNVKREGDHTFHEADHLDGDVDMYGVMQALIREQIRRKAGGRTDIIIPMRPDHGHRMLYDLNKESFPGYSIIGRLKGLAELRGLEMGIRKSLD
ncbi:MAG: mannonate dehydratase [Balneolales bacterium]